MLVFAASSLFAEPSPLPAASSSEGLSQSASQFDPYEFLIGEWEVKAAKDDRPAAIIRVRWGPNRSYLWYSSSLIIDGREAPHLEGILVWNGIHKNLDMLFSMDLKSGRVQEQGTLSVDGEGKVVRDITAVYGPGARPIGMPAVGPEGATTHFRETYKQIDANKVSTSAMRETKNGWVATFPGSDRMIMTRRSSG
jgi:hypothetical protein